VALSQADDKMDTFKMKDIAGCTADEITTANAAQAVLYECDAGVIGKQEVEDYQEALLDKEDPVLAGKIMIDAMYAAVNTGSYAGVSTKLCGCLDPYVAALPTCGDIGNVKSNITAYLPYCDVSSKCPSIDMKPVLEMAVACYNQSGDEICAKDSDHPCIGASRPLFEPEYLKVMLDCAVTVDMDVKQFMPPGMQLRDDFQDDVKLFNSMMAEQTSQVKFEDVKEGMCYLQNATKSFKMNATDGPSCKDGDEKSARLKASDIQYNFNYCMTTPGLDGKPDISDFIDVFIKDDNMDRRVKHVVKHMDQVIGKHPGLVGEQCGCLRGTYKEYEAQQLNCGKQYATFEGLHLASDFCSVVDNCKDVEPMLFLDVLRNCKIGDKSKETDTIVGQLCDPALEKDASGDYNQCYQSCEKIFTENYPLKGINCLYHSTINWDKLLQSARDQGTAIPGGVNVTNLLEAAMDNEGLLTWESVHNIVCAVAWEDPNGGDADSYEEGIDNTDFYGREEESTSPATLAGGAAVLLALGFALYTMVCKRPPPTVEDANEDEDDHKKSSHGDDSKGLISNDDEDI